MQWIHVFAVASLAFGAGPVAAQDVSAERAATEATLSVPSLAYRIVDQPVSGFLSELARDAGIRIDVTPAVRGQLQGLTLEGTVTEILDDLSRQQGLDAFRFNDVTYVSARSEMTTRVARLGDLPADDALTALDASGLVIDGFPIRETSDRRALALSGPPKYLALAETVIESIPGPGTFAAPAPGARIVRVFRGTEESQVPVR